MEKQEETGPSLEKILEYFHLPIRKAAEELEIGES